MGFLDKVKNKLTEAGGKAKEGHGNVTGDPELRAEGRADQGEAKFKQAGERAKDIGKDLKDGFKK